MKKILMIFVLTTALFSQGNDRYGTYISTWFDAMLMLTDTTYSGNAGQWIQDGRGNLTNIFLDYANGRIGIADATPSYTFDITGTFGVSSISNFGNSITVIGNVGATTYTGDGSALTGIASGTGGVENTGSTTIGADTDVSGSGEVVIQTRNVTRMTFTNTGGITFPLDMDFTLTGGVNGLSFDGTTLSVDALNNRIGINTASPTEQLSVGAEDENGINVRIGGWTSAGNIYASGGAVFGNNVKASLDVNQMEIMTTTASAGARALKMMVGEGITFHTVEGAVTAEAVFNNERMRIDETGKVGIGTAEPDDPLHIKSTEQSAVATQVTLQARDGGWGSGIDFVSQLDGGGIKSMAKIVAGGTSSWDTTPSTQDSQLQFYTSLNGVLTLVMTIEETGSLGLGTATGLSKLSINGGLHVGGDSDAGDNNLLVDGTLIVVGTTINMTTSGTVLTVGVGADNGTVSAGVFTDRTKYYDGDALSEIKKIKGENGKIVHSSLPEFVKVHKIREIKNDEGEVIDTEETIERDLGAMLSISVVAFQQLIAITEDFAKRIEKLEKL